ncbi:MAG: ABC transporter permease [Bacteroidota bacterium]
MIDRPLSTLLSLLLMTLGVGIISLLLQINHHIEQQMENNIRGIDMVVGAKGSPLQLILSSVYHIDAPTGNILLSEAEQLRKNPLVDYGIPLSFGDSYRGYRIVGTNDSYANLYNASLAEGKLWSATLEVTVGASAAQNLGLKIGDTFTGAHGLAEGGETHEDHIYKVVGIFNPANSVIDQLILTATESVWSVHDHEEEHSTPEDHEHGDEPKHEHDHEDEHHSDHDEPSEENKDRQITTMLVKFKSPMGMVRLPRMVNENTNMQAAVPVYEIQRLFNLLGVGVNAMQAIAIAIMIVSGLSVFLSLYRALRDRQYEMALMRTYGATRWKLAWLIVQEGLLLTSFGFIFGMVLSRIGIFVLSMITEANYHYTFSGWTWLTQEWWLLATALVVGLLASLIPAIRVFHINISQKLAHA